MRVSPWNRRSCKGAIGVIVVLGVAKPVGGWPQSYRATTLEHPNPQAWAYFGRSVAGVGDVNQDGVPDLLVGAHGQKVGDVGIQGRAFIISGADGGLLHPLDNPNPWQCANEFGEQEPPYFGWTVAAVGDMNADGVADVAVAAKDQHTESRASDFCDFAGRVFLFSGVNGTLIRPVFNPAPLFRFDEFGNALTGIGDVNQDGVLDLLVGASGAHVVWQQRLLRFAGRVEVISGANGNVLLTCWGITPQELAFFGSAVAGIEDLDDDGVPDFVVGAPLENVGSVLYAGRVHVISGRMCGHIRTLNSPNPQRTGYFGGAVARVGDVTGDGVSDLLVGAPWEDVGGHLNQGRAYVFDGANGTLLHTLDNPANLADAHFGHAVADLGDVDGDGFSDLLVGARGEFRLPESSSIQGGAYVFSGRGAKLLYTLGHPTPQPSALYGYAVAGVGDVNSDRRADLLVGAYAQHIGGALQQGRAFLFKSCRFRSWLLCILFPWWLWLFLGVIVLSAVWVGIRLFRSTRAPPSPVSERRSMTRQYCMMTLILALWAGLSSGNEHVRAQRVAAISQDSFPDSVDLRALAIQEIPAVIDAYLQQAHKRGLAEVRVIHRRGTGIDRAVVHALLTNHALVRRFFDARPESTWNGTVVVLRHP